MFAILGNKTVFFFLKIVMLIEYMNIFFWDWFLKWTDLHDRNDENHCKVFT